MSPDGDAMAVRSRTAKMVGVSDGDRKMGLRLPIGRHQFGHPFWLSNLTARQELAHNRLDVDHRRSVDRVQPLDGQLQTFNTQHMADSHAEAIGTVLAPLRENAGQRPIFATSWVARASLYLLFRYPVEQEDDLGMAKRIQPRQRVSLDFCRVQLDRGSAASPIVVNWIGPTTPHIPYGVYRERHESLPSIIPTAMLSRRMGVRRSLPMGNGPRKGSATFGDERKPIRRPTRIPRPLDNASPYAIG